MKWLILLVALWALYAFAGEKQAVPTVAQLDSMRNLRGNGCNDPFMHWCKRCAKDGLFCDE